MKQCTRCKEVKPISEFYLKKNGKPISMCKPCKSIYAKEWSEKNIGNNIKTEYSVSYTEMRHPNPMVMEGNVQKMMKKYHDEELKIAEAHLPFEAEAGLCDIILKG
jgi:hypothetical protein